MGNTYTRQNTSENRHDQRDGIRDDPGEKLTLPNSVVSRIMERPGAEAGAGRLSGVPNSVVSRIMERPEAEAEADRLSEGVTSRTPDSVRREMGGRLGADLSGVHFHSGPSSVRQSEALGAQAWTQGRDVYFGRSGFTPSLAAHELVHTVQQGAVRGNASVSMPFGAVQMKTGKGAQEEDPEEKFRADANTFAPTDYDKPLAGDAEELTELEAQAMRTFNSSRGVKVYNAIMPDLKNMVGKIVSNRKIKQVQFRPKPAMSFLIRAAYQDYALRDILIELVNKPIGLFKTGTRIRQYRALIKSVNDRLGEYQAEELGLQTGMIADDERNLGQKNSRGGDPRQVNKRSYELNVEDPEADKFNPGNIPEVASIQAEIDNAATFEDAYKVFAKFTGNPNSTIEYEKPKQDKGVVSPDLELFKNKLKHMSRQVWDYPELRNTIGNLLIADSTVKSHMGVMRTSGGRQKTDVYYNAYHDRSGDEGEQERRKEAEEIEEAGEWNGDFDHNGNHELGHLLAHNMPMRNDTEEEGEKSSKRHETENDIIKEVLLNRDILTPEQQGQIKYHRSDGFDKGKYSMLKHYSGEIDLRGSPALAGTEITSNYGKSAANEFYAETFADTYTHGTNAKRTSQEVVKEYEKRQKDLQQAKFKYNQSNWFMKLFRRKVKEPESIKPSDTTLAKMRRQAEALALAQGKPLPQVKGKGKKKGKKKGK